MELTGNEVILSPRQIAIIKYFSFLDPKVQNTCIYYNTTGRDRVKIFLLHLHKTQRIEEYYYVDILIRKHYIII
jgi:hypothetical protein